MIEFHGVSKRYGPGPGALTEIDLTIPDGQFCVVLGPSGSGKSTLLRMVNALIEPTAGQVVFDGQPVARPAEAWIRRRVGMIHQDFNLVPRLSVLDNVLCGALAAISAWRVLLRWWPRNWVRRALDLLDQVQLQPEHLNRRVSRLSGGEQQRVAIARAFITRPRVVLADEPVASLDPQTSRTILALLRESASHSGTTVICTLHQPELAIEFADRIVALRAGRISHDGPPRALDGAGMSTIYSAPALRPAPRRDLAAAMIS